MIIPGKPAAPTAGGEDRRQPGWARITATLAVTAALAAACGSSSHKGATSVVNNNATTTTAGPEVTSASPSTTAAGTPTAGAGGGPTATAPTVPLKGASSAPSSSASSGSGSVKPSTSSGSSGSGTSSGTASGSTSTSCATTLSSACDTQDASASLTGAGSTFDQPLFSRAFYAYHQKNSHVTVSYAAVGSGTGISDIKNQTVDFGATDVPLNPPSGNGGAILEIPVALGGVAITYNVPGVNQGLKLSGKALVDIYLGNITYWDDQALRSLNPGVNLPHQLIETVHRADSSGTSYIFTDYLNHVDPAWGSGPGVSKSPNWSKGNPNNIGGNGNPGVAADVSNTQYSIGYVELAYALEGSLTYAQMQNKDGAFLYPSLSSVSTAASQFPNVSWQNFSIVNAPGAGSYPICGYSWGLVYQNQGDKARGTALGKLLDWEASTGQGQASSIGYAPLPANIQALAHNTIMQMQSGGKPLFS